ncbi:hypothetical protein F183_A52240 [Bryobacterales bacterium F-183]|nr:hypothetical protein F183_A52240 [Bryobacterales bacterium F-183]
MLQASGRNKDTFTVSTPSENEIRMTRVFNAPRALVYEVMTKPEHIRRWWGNLGEGYSVPVCEVDLRVGCKWKFVNRHPQGEATFYGEYKELNPPDRVVFTEIFAPFPDAVSVVTAELEELEGGSKTFLRATVAYPSQEVRDMVMGTGMAQGAGTSYDRLEDILAELQ